MQGSTQKMAQLTASLLAYARGGKYQAEKFILSKFILSKFIERTIELFKHELPSTINLITDFSEVDHYIKADKPQIQMLLSAVLENAIEAINEIGTIKIVCRKEKIDQNDYEGFNIKSKNAYVCLTITDDGSGIENQIKKKYSNLSSPQSLSGEG